MSPFFRLLTAILLFPFAAFAQQSAYTTFYRQNWQLVNPAAMDKWQFFSNRHNSSWLMSSGYRAQWALRGLGGEAPRTFYASTEYAPGVNGGRDVFNPIRLGFTFTNDRAGAFGTFGGRFNFAYYIQNRQDFLHLGISGGFFSQSIQGDLTLPDGNTTAKDAVEKNYGDFSFGAFYRKRLHRAKNNHFYAGLSVPQAFFINQEGSLGRGMPVYAVVGSFLEMGPVDYAAIGSQRMIIVEPSLWVRYAAGIGYYSISQVAPLPFSVDADLRLYWRDRLWAGMGYGSNQQLSFEFGVIPRINDDNRLRIGTGFNLPAGRKYLNLGTSAELTMSYGLK